MSYYASLESTTISPDEKELELAQRRRRRRRDKENSISSWMPVTPERAIRKMAAIASLASKSNGERSPSSSVSRSPKVGSPARKTLTPSQSSSDLGGVSESSSGRRDIHRCHSDVIFRNRKLNNSSDEEDNNTNDNDMEMDALLGELTTATPSSSDGRFVINRLSKRHTGMIVAGVFGIWGGSIMAPMKACGSEFQGSSFLISFGIGSAIVNVFAWVMRYLYNVHVYQDYRIAFDKLPSLHFNVMWRPGFLSGLLWSVGNFFSLISVYYLGQGVGYPLVQSQMLISGLWGILYFEEIQQGSTIMKWFVSALLTLTGILWLSHEHVDEQ